MVTGALDEEGREGRSKQNIEAESSQLVHLVAHTRPSFLVQLILVSDARTADLREALRHIYNNIYVEYVVKNPLSVPGQPFRSVQCIFLDDSNPFKIYKLSFKILKDL